ncbi:MAG TPA: efflux RND transporter periplasmic adaptor subunit [Pseudorhodoplanes sp.]|nr:efflux RND transporter periplasmic adaptor subunit [Pseudorhodoplanes sp.]
MTRTSMWVVAGVLALAACAKQPDNQFQGWIEADLIFVSPDEQGRVETMNVREGDRVELGEELFTLDADIQKADVQSAEAMLANARQNFERAQQLLKTAAGTQKTYDDAQAALRDADARLNTQRTRLSRRRMASPVAGIVQQVYYRPGETVQPGKPLVSLLPPGNIKVRFFVPEALLPRIAIGDKVSITCDGCGGELSAAITFISQSVEFTPPVIYSLQERSKLVFLVEARPDKPDRLRVGQPVSVTVTPREIGK